MDAFSLPDPAFASDSKLEYVRAMLRCSDSALCQFPVTNLFYTARRKFNAQWEASLAEKKLAEVLALLTYFFAFLPFSQYFFESRKPSKMK